MIYPSWTYRLTKAQTLLHGAFSENPIAVYQGLANEEALKQVEALSLCFLRETLSIIQNLGLTDEERKNMTVIIEALQSYVDGHLNETVERRNFCRRKQQPRECFDDFLISLWELSKTCRFYSEMCTEKNVRDQVIEGVYDSDAVEDLLQENNLTLARAITKCHGKEATKNIAQISRDQNWKL